MSLSTLTPDTAGSSSQLAANVTYDDQGLYFTLVLGLVTLIGLGAATIYLHTTTTLWIVRLYRPNHTGVRREDESCGDDGAGGEDAPNRTRRRRRGVWRGVRLPFCSSLFCPPSWSDWWRVEECESLPHLYSAFTSSPRTTMSKGHGAHTHNDDNTEDEKDTKEEASNHHGSVAHANSSLPPQSTPTEVYMTEAEEPHAASASGSDRVTRRELGDDACRGTMQETPYASRVIIPSHSTNDKAKDGYHMSSRPNTASGREGGHQEDDDDEDNKADYSSAEGERSCTSDTRTTAPTPTIPIPPRGERLVDTSLMPDDTHTTPPVFADLERRRRVPTTPIDPQIAVYLFTLKYFATTMLVGSIFTIWIALIASRDDYIREYTIRQDVHHCRRYTGQPDLCQSLAPYCRYREGAESSRKNTAKGGCVRWWRCPDCMT